MTHTAIDAEAGAALAQLATWWRFEGRRHTPDWIVCFCQEPSRRITAGALAPLARFAEAAAGRAEADLPADAAAVLAALAEFLRWEVAPGATRDGNTAFLGATHLVGVAEVRALCRLAPR